MKAENYSYLAEIGKKRRIIVDYMAFKHLKCFSSFKLGGEPVFQC
jgi:hypothetical protein